MLAWLMRAILATRAQQTGRLQTCPRIKAMLPSVLHLMHTSVTAGSFQAHAPEPLPSAALTSITHGVTHITLQLLWITRTATYTIAHAPTRHS